MNDNSTNQLTTTKAIDLDSLDPTSGANEGVEIELQHPVTKRGLGSFITIHGLDSEAAQELRAQVSAKTSNRIRVARDVFAGFDVAPDEADTEKAVFCAALTLGWRNVVYKGEALTFSRANAQKLYRNVRWIREQVDAQIANTALFIKG